MNWYAEMAKANPQYILRNHMAQKAIELAERNDFSEVERLFQYCSANLILNSLI